MKSVFSDKKNYSELILKMTKRRDPNGIEIDPLNSNPLANLPDGRYEALRYANIFELRDGTRYKTPDGVRHTRKHASWQYYDVKGGKLFSGMTEVGGAMQGASYGPKDPDTSTKITIDNKGFRVPEGVMKEFKINQRQYSSDGLFKGGTKTPTISISKDNSIIRTKKPISQGAASQPNMMTNTTLDWNNDKSFHLAVEPWITSPIQNDVCDGIYIGSIKANKIDTGKVVINLTVSIAIDYPESVLVLIKNKKAYVFKQSQLVATTGSRIFSTALFSEITSDEQFRDYAHNLMKEAHKENYDEGKTDKVVSDLLSNAGESPNYGELVGRLKSGLGNKSYSENDATVDYRFSYALVEPKLEMQALIGTLAMSPSFAKLFHWCTTDNSIHRALDEFVYPMIGKVDTLAENYLATTKAVNFQICIVPDTMDPERYFTRLQEFIVKYQTNKLANESAFQSLVDDISNLIGSLLYKLRRLKSGKRLFSFVDDQGNTYFSYVNKDMRNKARKSISEALNSLIDHYVKKHRRSPIKEVQSKDGKKVVKYVESHVASDSALADILKAVAEGLDDAATNISIYTKSKTK